MDNRAIGVFDSGLGGLTAVKELHKILPNENIVYLGDTGRVPYGSRSRETIIKYAQQDIDFLIKKDIKMILAACGTVSSTLPREISSKLPVPYVDSNAFGRAMRGIRSDIHVYGNPCPLLVHLVENGMIEPDNQITTLAVQMYLEPLIKEKIDTLILGCTHYPLLYETFNRILDYKVTLIDSGQCAAKAVRNTLLKNGMLSDRTEPGTTEYNVTDEIETFDKTASIFLGEPVTGAVNRIELL